MDDLQTIQDLINKQAEDKLNRDINEWFDKIKGSPFFDCISDEVIESTANKLRHDFSKTGSTLKSKIRRKMLPKYIKRESKKYFKILEELKGGKNESS